MAVIACAGIGHRFGAVVALRDVTFSVAEGEMFGVLGRNGAGKSTLFDVLATLRRPDQGEARVFGLDLVREARRVRAATGVVFQTPTLDDRLTAREILELHAALHSLSDRRAAVDAALAMAEVDAGRPVRGFSGGMKRRLELARALMHRPRLLLLDEPTAGLDPKARRDLWRHVAALRREGLTVFVTTHDMNEAMDCDRVAILAGGRLVAVEAPQTLAGRAGGLEAAVIAEDAS